MDNIQLSQWKDKYELMHKKELKLCIRTLKRNQAPYNKVQYVSRLLRSKINKSDAVKITVSKVDEQIKGNFWSYIKHSFYNKNALLPTFIASSCTDFFTMFFSAINPLATFIIPSWIPSLSQPSTPYDLSPPTYQLITNVIRRIKASGSPCPLDKILIIPYKRCPYLSFLSLKL